MLFDEAMKLHIWNKASTVDHVDASTWRRDQCGAWIKYTEFGNRFSDYGWEIDYILPLAEGGVHEEKNLRPLQWENQLSKREGRLTCVLRAIGPENMRI
ncbi:HNH endonuclease signature motif containing protein [Undibacterium rugosum]|uniref:HNH endonuclease n=1 Tax=Undibacterium rugosum TaxID=2762291 RepID=A0A923I0V4_9BURK|nr:HNH endonuclease signature motif containing protein [Undibacterium rugosum]MBC3934315.1 HNH endonuclease [Undibacterium rugosum]MBR7779597.1 HNH endonuclease [Undibacterium rugosum]